MGFILFNTFFISSILLPTFALLLLAYIKAQTPHPFSAGSDIFFLLFVYVVTALFFPKSFTRIMSEDFRDYCATYLAVSIILLFFLLRFSTKTEAQIAFAYNRYLGFQMSREKSYIVLDKKPAPLISISGLKFRTRFLYDLTRMQGFPFVKFLLSWAFVISMIGVNLFIIFGQASWLPFQSFF